MPRLCVTLPGREGLGNRRPINILGRLRISICLPSSPNSPQDTGENREVPRHACHSSGFTEPIPTLAPCPLETEQITQTSTARPDPIPIHSPSSTTSLPSGSRTDGPGRLDAIRQVLRDHQFAESVVLMAANPLRKSSNHVYNSHWNTFIKWVKSQTFITTSYHTTIWRNT